MDRFAKTSRGGRRPFELAVPLTESVDATMGGRHFGRFPAGAIIGASALSDSRLPQLEAIAGESCAVAAAVMLPMVAADRLAPSASSHTGGAFKRNVRGIV